MIFCAPDDHAIDMICVSLGIRELFEHEYADPFTPYIAIGCRREGFAASIRTQHSCFAETDVCLRRDERINTTNNRHVTLTTLNSAHASVDGDQGARAGCLNSFAGSMQVEEIAHAIGSYRWCLTCHRIAFECHICTHNPFTIATTARTDEQGSCCS